MSNKRLNFYKGKLNPIQIAEGMNIANENSIRLLDDAKLLYESNRYPSAVALAILSIEESGKKSILRNLVCVQTSAELNNIWKDYRSHVKKNVLWLIYDMFKQGARKLDDFKPMFDASAEHPFLLDNIKQISIYTDCLGNAHWSIPNEVIDKDLSESIILIADILSKGHYITPKEIELWKKHMYNTSSSNKKESLVNWHTEMINFGLLPTDFKMTELCDWLGINLENN